MRWLCLLCCFIGTVGAGEQQLNYVKAVSTPGEGVLVTMSDYWLVVLSKSYEIHLPENVDEGQKLTIDILTNGKWQSEQFSVGAISIHQELCRLHTQHPSNDGRFPSDAIYVEPCQEK
ncbi:hypothetical protein MHO82_06615 [Vibrio sp. Of7-15]|nr:hypothetical protein [Vibrio sp. Of7-15]